MTVLFSPVHTLGHCKSLPLVTAVMQSRLRQTSALTSWLVTWELAVCPVFHKDCYLHSCMSCHMLLRSSQLYLTSKSCLSRLVFSAKMLGESLCCHYCPRFRKTYELVLFPQPVNTYYSVSKFSLSLATITQLLNFHHCTQPLWMHRSLQACKVACMVI